MVNPRSSRLFETRPLPDLEIPSRADTRAFSAGFRSGLKGGLPPLPELSGHGAKRPGKGFEPRRVCGAPSGGRRSVPAPGPSGSVSPTVVTGPEAERNPDARGWEEPRRPRPSGTPAPRPSGTPAPEAERNPEAEAKENAGTEAKTKPEAKA
jgi:hypothetical protein